ncbi:glutathione S-transferase C-terminal domain-containing protein [Actinacidiphila glaucinigra]|uniref:Putative glutathione S-transferase n=1 Tax=Actinacidiphila glaucinigra TaxID=235986 RepID=A0A239DVC9_9ACTN|nr:glutathione S-transferase C-terminal domain-containing protein [Actinacidiphila glaucinigra]SNS35702.1 putative glutathione S-transferase [Actinacidiphila glaucinigra]
MTETIPHDPGLHVSCSALPRTSRPDRFRSRIGVDLAGGFYPAPRRYELFLSPGCPLSQRVAITLDLLGLRDSVVTTPVPAGAAGGTARAALRGAYEATWHRYDGPLTVPALCDRWTGRVVSNHTPDILGDLTGRLGAEGCAPAHPLCPPALLAGIEAVRHTVDAGLTRAARRAAQGAPSGRGAALRTLHTTLGLLDRRLARGGPHVLGAHLTAADVDLWVALVHLPGGLLPPYARLTAYVARLDRHPAFHAQRTAATLAPTA